ncbi:MAG: CoB--CoM heterodisulfide reductase iron-sulfur subunit A family protein [Desulfobacterales bacterium]|nr:CoB--CoM heterodisulfide reductase iron-sulfur subunit A family protein [Desulfobacterales bacterium]
MMAKKVLVIGGGVAGLTAASEMADLDIDVEIIEQSDFPGGHAIGYTCKATDQCVKCGACMVEEKLDRVVQNPKIKLMAGTRIQDISNANGFSVTLQKKPAFIDPVKCSNCGICLEKCPEKGAVTQGFSKSHTPFYAISGEKCLYLQGQSCSVCRETCPESAINLDAVETTASTRADALILATGFTPFSPGGKPYGYGKFKNVITNLEMERLLRRNGRVLKPSSGTEVEHIAFIQCVGSRDAKLNHLWCSKVCCGSALRMAGLVKARQPETRITFFYMDVQTFGRDFELFYDKIREDVRLIRAIPGDIYPAAEDQLRVTFFDNASSESVQEAFDMVVLSVGMTPCDGMAQTVETLKLPLAETGFAKQTGQGGLTPEKGIFTAGAVTGPMSISESIASAGKTAFDVVKYLGV